MSSENALLGGLGAGGAVGMNADSIYQSIKKNIKKPSLLKNISAKTLPTAAAIGAGALLGKELGKKQEYPESLKKQQISNLNKAIKDLKKN